MESTRESNNSIKFKDFKQIFEQVEILANLYRAISDHNPVLEEKIEKELREKYPDYKYRKCDVFTPWDHTDDFIQKKLAGSVEHSKWKKITLI
jgi:hypothetical protein